MGKLLGEAFVKLTLDDVANLRELLNDTGFAWAVGTGNLPKFAAVLAYAERQMTIAGDIEIAVKTDG